MNNFALSAVFLLLVAFFLGCVVGCLLRGALRRRKAQADTATITREERAPTVAPAAERRPLSQAAEAEPAPAEPAAAVTGEPDAGRAEMATAGRPDDLKRIKGVGPAIEKKLKDMGVERFEQIANWTRADVEKVDAELNFKGRIDRDDWISQAKSLASGA